MKDLKDYIDNNRYSFDSEEPMEGHAQRFEQLLDKIDKQEVHKAKKNVKRMTFVTTISVAASILVLFLGFRYYTSQANVDQMQLVQGLAQPDSLTIEFKETNQYYSQQLEQQIADIKEKLAYATPENKAQLDSDLNEMKASNKLFVAEIASVEDKDLAIFYLIKHYEAKIETLEYIDRQLETHIITQKS